MDLSLVPELYMPSVNNEGNYIDMVSYIRHGMICACATRKDKVYDTTTKFANHCKTKTHQQWLKHLNENKLNFYAESHKKQQLIESQQQIITQLENKIQTQLLLIDYLTKQVIQQKQPEQIYDLLNIDD